MCLWVFPFFFFFFCSSAKKRHISRSLLFLQIYEKASCSSGILLTRANKASRSLREALTSLCVCASSLFETYFLLLGFFSSLSFFHFYFPSSRHIYSRWNVLALLFPVTLNAAHQLRIISNTPLDTTQQNKTPKGDITRLPGTLGNKKKMFFERS